MIPISICMIAKNEEKYIGECLRRLSAYNWEIVVADTGSTDRTAEIALQYTPKVFHFEWINDFSAARNYAVSKASNDHILVVDCDEYLEKNETTDRLIQQLTQKHTPLQVGLVNLLNPASVSEATASADQRGNDLIHEHIARFFNRNFVHYEGSIHEQLTAINGAELEFIQLPLTFYHYGYSTLDIKKHKASRNITLLEKELSSNGPDPYIYFQLGQSYFGMSEYAQALPYFDKALGMDVNEKEAYVQTLIESYGYCLLYLKQYQKALELEGVYSIFSRQADFVFLMGLIYMNNGMFEKAIEEFLHATKIPAYSVDGVNSYKAYYNIGVIYECAGDVEKAMKYYSKCGNYSPALKRIIIQNN